MKLFNNLTPKILCLTAALLSLCLINTPAFSTEKIININSLNEINDNTIQGLARKDMASDTKKLSVFNKNTG